MASELIVFDGDDTLWFVEPLYDEARLAARSIVEMAGHDGGAWESFQRAIDVRNVTKMGTDPERFPTSCAQAYEMVAQVDGLEGRSEVIIAIRKAARTVFERRAFPNPEALPALAALRQQYSMALLTKGDRIVQRRRIRDAGVGHFFDHVEIVADKTSAEFAQLLNVLARQPQAAWSVGNSLASDINPALRLGMSAIWIDAHVWEHERRELDPADDAVVAADSLLQVPDILRGTER